jgi:hypothetical protein
VAPQDQQDILSSSGGEEDDDLFLAEGDEILTAHPHYQDEQFTGFTMV